MPHQHPRKILLTSFVIVLCATSAHHLCAPTLDQENGLLLLESTSPIERTRMYRVSCWARRQRPPSNPTPLSPLSVASVSAAEPGTPCTPDSPRRMSLLLGQLLDASGMVTTHHTIMSENSTDALPPLVDKEFPHSVRLFRRAVKRGKLSSKLVYRFQCMAPPGELDYNCVVAFLSGAIESIHARVGR